MKNRVPAICKAKLSDDKQMQKKGRGASEMLVSKQSQVAVTKWQDNKAVLMASNVHGIEPQDSCIRWSAKEKCHIRWVDLCDRMISFYPMSSRTRKWTVRTVMHLFDLAVTNSWIQYRTDHKASGKPEKERLQYLEFKLLLAEQIIAQAQGGRGQQVASEEEMSSDEEGVRSNKEEEVC